MPPLFMSFSVTTYEKKFHTFSCNGIKTYLIRGWNLLQMSLQAKTGGLDAVPRFSLLAAFCGYSVQYLGIECIFLSLH